jgi:hypothetical protein
MIVGNTLGAARLFLEHLPDDTPAQVLDLEDIQFVVLVDSRGNAQMVPAKTTRVLILSVHIPLSS